MPDVIGKSKGYRKSLLSSSEEIIKKPASHNKILVLCVDRDDDIGSKGGLETPIVGRSSCINAGIRLAIEDPEDPDALGYRTRRRASFAWH